MTRLRLAVVGLGRVGMHCCKAIAASGDLAIGGIVRRAESLTEALPDWLSDVPVVAHIGALGHCDAALICLPSPQGLEAATALLQHRVAIVEAAELSGAAAALHHDTIGEAARRHRTAAVVGAGWNPGMAGLLAGLLAVLAPKGESRVHDRPGVSLHHTLAAKAIPGVADALCAELRTGDGRVQRYVYVELERSASLDRAEPAIRNDPLFADEETIVLSVPSIAALEDAGHGIVLERWGTAAGVAHQRFLLEGRFDRHAVTAQIMVAAGRAAPMLAPGGHSLADVPPAALWRGLQVDTGA